MFMTTNMNTFNSEVHSSTVLIQFGNSHSRFASALSRLPTETLCNIFVHCLPEDDSEYLSRASNVAMLTRVCRRWREVSVSMSNLWCRLSVGKDWQQTAFCYETWLRRSRGRPLSLALDCHTDHWTQLRSLLGPYINQVSSLSLDFSSGANQPEVMIADFFALEKLTISTDGSDLTPAVAKSISQLPLTLRSLKTTNLLPVFDLEYNPTWAHLTNVEINAHGLNTLPSLLNLCPHLSSLTIVAVITEIEALEPSTHTTLQSIRIISGDLFGDTVEDLCLFDALSLPNLRALEARYVQPWPHEEFKEFLTRSKCPLESLTFGDGVVTTDEQRAEYVALIPSLKIVVDPMRT
ncbi:hypothetical protein DEU56DRAFT_885244, partial [Suillus clintonianus]|uniref:uncharacterized protein n=1 Tax=Suillus clintonianus TaxID=1904413 RepID=UPI001B876450